MADCRESPTDDKLGGRKQDEVQTSSPLSELLNTPSGGSDVSEVEKEGIYPDNPIAISSSSQGSSSSANDDELAAPGEDSPSTLVLQRRQQSAPLQDVPQTTTTTQESPKAARPAKNANGRTPLPTSRPKTTSGRGALPTVQETRAAARTAAPVGGISRPTTTRAAATAATAAARNPLRPSIRRHVQIVSRAARPAADGAAAPAAVPTPGRTSTYTGRRLLPNGRTALPTAPTPTLIVSARYTPGRLRIVEGQLQRVALGEDAQVSDGSQQPPPALTLRQQAAVPAAHTLSPDEAEGAGAAARPPRAPRPAMAVLATQTSPASIAEAAAALPPTLPSTPSATENSQTQTQTQPADQQQHWMYKRVVETDAVCDTCHRTLGEVMAATSRGDGANIARLGRVVQQCLTCGRSTCRACFDADRRHPRHPLHRLILDWAAPASPAGSSDSRGGKDDSSGGSGGSAPSSQDRPSSRAMSVDLPREDSDDDGPALGGGGSGGAAADGATDAGALGDSYTPTRAPVARPDGRGFPPTVTLNSANINQFEASFGPNAPLPVSGNNDSDNNNGNDRQVTPPAESSIPDTESPPSPPPPPPRRSGRNRGPPPINTKSFRRDPYEVPSSPLRNPPNPNQTIRQQQQQQQQRRREPTIIQHPAISFREPPQYRLAQGPDLLQPPQTQSQRGATLTDDIRHFGQRCATTHAQHQLAFIQEDPLHQRSLPDLRGPGAFQDHTPADTSGPSIFSDLGTEWTHESDQNMVRHYRNWLVPRWTASDDTLAAAAAARDPTDPRSMGQPLMEALTEARARANRLYRCLEADTHNWHSDMADLASARDLVRRLDVTWRGRVDLAAERADRGMLAALGTVKGSWNLSVLAESPFGLAVSKAWLDGMRTVFEHYYPEREDDA